jgi:hypothetical protein
MVERMTGGRRIAPREAFTALLGYFYYVVARPVRVGS